MIEPLRRQVGTKHRVVTGKNTIFETTRVCDHCRDNAPCETIQLLNAYEQLLSTLNPEGE